MSKKQNEINDNEIRVISSSEKDVQNSKRRRIKLCCFIILWILLLGCLVLWFARSDDNIENACVEEVTEIIEEEPLPVQDEEHTEINGFTVAIDTTVNKKGLLILSPVNARPKLAIGAESLSNHNIILATQAADIRRDNGQIAGTFVLDGELISKGEAKAGYCAIINGELSIGVADATPMFEQTLTEGGCFFRQYPLVVGGQIVENKPKGKAIRKALAEISGKIFVVMSKDRLTFHEFSQLLINAGVKNAIYLVGSSSHGFYINKKGEKILTGTTPWERVENVSYIVWEQV